VTQTVVSKAFRSGVSRDKERVFFPVKKQKSESFRGIEMKKERKSNNKKKLEKLKMKIKACVEKFPALQSSENG
jgi:hypothetical protein